MNEDYLGFDDPAERFAATDPALVSRPPLGPRELIVSEELHRKDDFPACNRLLFVMVTAEGEEVLEEPLVWQRIMGWPREPTVEEVQQFQLNARVARLARWWDRLAAARTADEQPVPLVASTTEGQK
jgi:hypothetical protein